MTTEIEGSYESIPHPCGAASRKRQVVLAQPRLDRGVSEVGRGRGHGRDGDAGDHFEDLRLGIAGGGETRNLRVTDIAAPLDQSAGEAGKRGQSRVLRQIAAADGGDLARRQSFLEGEGRMGGDGPMTADGHRVAEQQDLALDRVEAAAVEAA